MSRVVPGRLLVEHLRRHYAFARSGTKETPELLAASAAQNLPPELRPRLLPLARRLFAEQEEQRRQVRSGLWTPVYGRLPFSMRLRRVRPLPRPVPRPRAFRARPA